MLKFEINTDNSAETENDTMETVATYTYWKKYERRKKAEKRKTILAYILKASGKLIYFLACFFLITAPISMVIAWVFYAENILAIAFLCSALVICLNGKDQKTKKGAYKCGKYINGNTKTNRTKHNRAYA